MRRLLVTRSVRQCSARDVFEYLSEMLSVPAVPVEKLRSHSIRFASFCVIVKTESIEEIDDASTWRSGARFRVFFGIPRQANVNDSATAESTESSTDAQA